MAVENMPIEDVWEGQKETPNKSPYTNWGGGGGTSIVLLVPLFLLHVPESQEEMSQSNSLQPSPNK